MTTYIHPFLFWECSSIGIDIYEQEDGQKTFVCAAEYPSDASLKVIMDVKIAEAKKLYDLLGVLISQYDWMEEATRQYFEKEKKDAELAGD
jgi:hypothetical protein